METCTLLFVSTSVEAHCSTTRIDHSDPGERQSESRGHAHLHAPSPSRDEGEGPCVLLNQNNNKNDYDCYLSFASNKPDCRLSLFLNNNVLNFQEVEGFIDLLATIKM